MKTFRKLAVSCIRDGHVYVVTFKRKPCYSQRPFSVLFSSTLEDMICQLDWFSSSIADFKIGNKIPFIEAILLDVRLPSLAHLGETFILEAVLVINLLLSLQVLIF